MRARSPIAMAVLGAALLAIAYGLARFVFGLFLPAIRADLGLGASAAGIVGALPFVSFLAAAPIGPAIARTLGTRLAGGLAVGLAAAGLVAIAAAPGVLVLGVGVAVCGVATGLSSPVMARAVRQAVRPGLRGRVNAVHNAGTSLGVALGTPAMIWLLGAWRSAYLAFAILAALGAVAALVLLPPGGSADASLGGTGRPPSPSRAQWRAVARLGALAGGMGLVSSIYWVFAPDLVVNAGGLSERDSAFMWLAIGIAGLAGGAAGDLIDRFGPGPTHALALALMGGALGLAAAAPGSFPLALISAACFGAAYMTLTGFYLVRGVRAMAERPALGPVLPLSATTLGQALGSALAGWTIDAAGYTTAFAGFAAFGLVAALASRSLAER